MLDCLYVFFVFVFFSLWDRSCSWANNIVKYGFRQREARLSTVKTGFIYLLLAEFSVRTVNYGPSFFHRLRLITCLLYGFFVQDARFDSHLTGVKKESFYWRTKTIAHNKGFPRK